ncbi:MAG: hypothetical protein AAGD01_01565 [Acidobacteriota bacterium]
MKRIFHLAPLALCLLGLASPALAASPPSWSPGSAPALTPPPAGSSQGEIDEALEAGFDSATGQASPKLPPRARELGALTGTFDCSERILGGDDKLYDLTTARRGAWTLNGLALELRSWSPLCQEISFLVFDQQKDQWRLDHITAPNYELRRWVGKRSGERWEFEPADAGPQTLQRLTIEPTKDEFRIRREDLRRRGHTTVQEVLCKRREE